MKIIFQDPTNENEEDSITIIVSVKEMSDKITRVLDALKGSDTLTVRVGKDKAILPVDEIFYCESVDRKIFVYDAKQVYETDLKLYELEEILGDSSFMRITQSTIVNLSKIRLISPGSNARLTAILDNDEKLVISRKYVAEMRKRFEL